MVYFNNSLAQRGRQWAHALEILNKMKAKDVQAKLKMAESCKVEVFKEASPPKKKTPKLTYPLKNPSIPPPKKKQQPGFPKHPGFPPTKPVNLREASWRWTLAPPVAWFLPVHRPRNWPKRRRSSWCLGGRNRDVHLPSL